MSKPDSDHDLAAQFVTLNEQLRSDANGLGTLQHLVELAVAFVPHCEWAAITAWPLKRAPHSLAASGDVAATADQLQYKLGQGPCLAAAKDALPMHVADISTETRWPRFCAGVQAATPVRGVLSFYLADKPHRCALNFYTPTTYGFDQDAFNLATLFAAHARVLLMHVASSDNAAHLQSALSTSRHIGAAVGILMSAHQVTAEQAFELLSVSSQHLHRKLATVADEVTRTGSLPLQEHGRKRTSRY